MFLIPLKHRFMRSGDSNQELTVSLEQFVSAEDSIKNTFEAIDQSVNDCVASSSDAQTAVKEQNEAVNHLSGSMEDLHALATELKENLNQF